MLRDNVVGQMDQRAAVRANHSQLCLQWDFVELSIRSKASIVDKKWDFEILDLINHFWDLFWLRQIAKHDLSFHLSICSVFDLISQRLQLLSTILSGV